MRKRGLLLSLFFLLAMGATAQGEYAPDGKSEITGGILSKKASVVKMKCDPDSVMPGINTKGELSKWFESELFGGVVTGWMSIGKMKVTALEGFTVTMFLEEELSIVYENGQKKNHFPAGQKVKFSWEVVRE